jgi:hypothetical protein
MPESKFTPEKASLAWPPSQEASSEKKAADKENKIRTRLEQSRYDEKVPPKSCPAVASLGDTEVIWKRNIHTLVAGSKVGKSRFLAALIKSMVKGVRALGWRKNLGGAKVIYLDFEQDQEDFYDSMNNQAGVTKDEVYAFNLSGVNADQAIACVAAALEMFPDASILIMDGVADLCNNVNDPDEANRLIAQLMDLANKHDIAIVGVLHLNPGSDAKSRGHLGSQLERKSKTILQINEADGIRTVFTKLARKKPILEKNGIRFHWCTIENNFVELEGTKAQEEQRKKAEELRVMMNEILNNRTVNTFAHHELVKAIIEFKKQSESAAKTKIRKMKDYGVIVLKDKLYRLKAE